MPTLRPRDRADGWPGAGYAAARGGRDVAPRAPAGARAGRGAPPARPVASSVKLKRGTRPRAGPCGWPAGADSAAARGGRDALEQELQGRREPLGPVSLLVAAALGRREEHRLARDVALVLEDGREPAGVAQGVRVLLRPGIDVDAARRTAVPLDVVDDCAAPEPQRWAHRAHEPEG